MTKSVIKGVLIVAAAIMISSFTTDSEAASNDLDSKTAAINILSKTANDLCKDIPISGQESDVELTGEATAELDNLIKKIIDLRVGGAARYMSDEYKGVLRKDLAVVLKNSTDCKVEVLKLLHDDVFPKPGPTPEPPTAQASLSGRSYEVTLRDDRDRQHFFCDPFLHWFWPSDLEVQANSQ